MIQKPSKSITDKSTTTSEAVPKALRGTAVKWEFCNLKICKSDFYEELFGVEVSSAFLKSRAAELIQYRFPVGLGPSSNTWPRWAPHFEQRTSVRFMSVFIVRRRRLQLTRKNRHHKNDDVNWKFLISVLVSTLLKLTSWTSKPQFELNKNYLSLGIML